MIKVPIIIFISLLLYGCGNEKPALCKSVHKNWQFKKYDVINPNLHEGVFIGGASNFSIDLTDKDTAIIRDLKGGKPPMHTPYKINDSAISLKGADGSIKFDIIKLTNSELTLCPITKNYHPKKTDSNIMAMIFTAQQK